MKLLKSLIAIFTATLTAAARTDDIRTAYAKKVRAVLNLPVNYGHVTLTDVFHVKELDTFAYVYIGKPFKDAVASQGKAFWASENGKEIRSYGFRDTIYVFGDGDKEYGVYSCAEQKWYSGITVYCKAKGLPTG